MIKEAIIDRLCVEIKKQATEPLTTRLNNGIEVLAKIYDGKPYAITYVNRTQAQNAVTKLGDEWTVYRGLGRPFYVARANQFKSQSMQSTKSAIVDKICAEIVKQSVDFATKEQYDKYMKEHPDADRSKHRVVQKQPETKKPEEKSKIKQWFEKRKEKKKEKGRAKLLDAISKSDYTSQKPKDALKNIIKNTEHLIEYNSMEEWKNSLTDAVKASADKESDPNKVKFLTNLTQDIQNAKIEWKRHPNVGRLIPWVNGEPTEKIGK